MSKRDRERRDEYASAAGWADSAGGDYTAFNIPDGMKLYKPKAGKAMLAMVPYKVGEGNPHAEKGKKFFQRTYWVHARCIGPNNESHVCLAKTLGKKCPGCEQRAYFQTQPNSKEIVQKMKPKRRELYLVVDLENAPKEVQLFDASFATFGEALTEVVGDKEAGGKVDFFRSDEDGLNLRVTFKEESGGDFNFIDASRIDLIKRDKPLRSSLLEDLPCLDELLTPLSYKEFEKLMEGGGGRGDEEDEDDEDEDDDDLDTDDDDDDEPPRKSKSKKSRDDDEDDDEDDDDPPPKSSKKNKSKDDDEDDEDEPPRKKKSSKKKSKDDDDDEDDDDSDIPFDDDDDEDDDD